MRAEDRSIIHLNVADFAVAVERLIDPRLAGRPLIVAPQVSARATVFDMSEEAYRTGVRKGMFLRRAARLCRDAVVVPPQTARYEQAMADLLRLALPYSPLVEPGEDDGHIFIDVTGTSRIFGPAADVAWRMRHRALQNLGLNPIWSLAANKLVAKVASRLVKPQGEYIVPAGDEEALLTPLPLGLIPGLETYDLKRLTDLNLTHVYQVTRLSPAQLEVILGPRADWITAVLHGRDNSPVLPVGQTPPHIRLEHTFAEDTNTPALVESRLYAMVERCGRQLRLQRRAARRLSVSVTYSDGRCRTRRMTLDPPTANDLALFPQARKVLHLAWTRRVRLRRLRLICDRLVFPPTQLPLFEDEQRTLQRQTCLVTVLDQIRSRFGNEAIVTGRTARQERHDGLLPGGRVTAETPDGAGAAPCPG